MLNNTREGKRYKDWLFERAGTWDAEALDVLAGGAVLILRDVVREHLRREHEPAWMRSLNGPVDTSAGEGLTLEDLLPGGIDPSDEVATREFQHLSAVHAGEFLKDMPLRERVVVLARELGLSIAHPAVERVAGCRKSLLGKSYHACFERLAGWIRRQYEEDDPEAVRILTVMTCQELGSAVRAWGAGDKNAAVLLSLAGAS
jgi:hypothetical protein